MRLKFIEQWKFRLSGRAVPTVKAEDITDDGIVGTLHLMGDCKMRANSIVNTWDAKGYEVVKDSKKITLINEKGISQNAYVVSDAGITINLYTQPSAFPNREDIIGKAATMDDIADAMDLNKSMKNLIIGILIGCGIGAFILGPMLTTIMS
jgi:hypothetical protein